MKKRIFLQSVVSLVLPLLAQGESSLSVIRATPFVLDQAKVHRWEKEKPAYREGTLLVLRGPREVVLPRQAAENLIYVDDHIAERVKVLDENTVVVLVPHKFTQESRVWVGPAALPEKVSASERQSAYAEMLKSPEGSVSFSLAPSGVTKEKKKFPTERELYEFARGL